MSPLKIVISVALLVLGFVLQIVGLTSPGWGVVVVDTITDVGTRQEFGLWKACAANECNTYIERPGWLKISQTTANVGLVAAVASTLFIGIIIIYTSQGRECLKYVRVSALGISIIAAGFIVMTAGLMLVKLRDEVDPNIGPGMSFGFSITAAILRVVSGLIAFDEAQHYKYKKYTEDPNAYASLTHPTNSPKS